jgi:hypothetical protein
VIEKFSRAILCEEPIPQEEWQALRDSYDRTAAKIEESGGTPLIAELNFREFGGMTQFAYILEADIEWTKFNRVLRNKHEPVEV